MFEFIKIEDSSLEILKKIKNLDTSLVFIPSYRTSYDVLLLDYVLYSNDIQLPMSILLKNKISLFKSLGILEVNDKLEKSKLYQEVYKQYLSTLFNEKNNF